MSRPCPPRLSLALALAAACAAPPGAAAQVVFEHWGQEACNARRSNAIAYAGGAPAAGGAYVLVTDLGAHKLDVAGVWPTLPVFAPSGHVVVADVDNFLLILPPPERVTPPDISGGPPDPAFSWETTATYVKSGAFFFGAPPAPSSSAAVDEDGVAYWVNRHQNRLYAADLSGVPTGGPIVEPWLAATGSESLNLSATGGGFKKYAGEFALLLHANRLWLPEPDEHSALVVDALYGVRAVATGFTEQGQRLLGSVGSFAVQLGAETAAFTNFGTNPAGKGGIFGVQSEAPFAASWEQWQASVPFNAASGDFQHPVSLLFSRAGQTWSCVVASTVQAFSATLGLQGGLRISGVSDKDGSVCGDGVLNQWGTNDGAYAGTYLMVNEFTANATWASAPAVVPDGDG